MWSFITIVILSSKSNSLNEKQGFYSIYEEMYGVYLHVPQKN